MSAVLIRSARSVLLVAVVGAGLGPAAAQIPFTEEGFDRGVDYPVQMGSEQFGVGLAFADLDGDGDPDIVTTGRSGGMIGIFENDGSGMFSDRSGTVGIAAITAPSGVSAADYDGDGDLDLHFSNWFQPSRLYRNNGNWSFTDVSSAAGVGLTGPGQAATWGDYDGDGWLDMYQCMRTLSFNSPVRNRLFRNLGNGTFVNVAETLGVSDGDAPSLLVAWFDFDRDGDDDMYLGNDKGTSEDWTNHLYRNDGGTFTDVTVSSGTGADVDCMGIALGDLDYNGFTDIYMTNLPVGNVLLMNDGDGTFTDQTLAAGVAAYRYGWGTIAFDYNNDVNLDLFVCNTGGENQLFQGGAWPMSDIAPQLALNDPADSYCAAIADVDGDGDLDLLVASRPQLVQLHINNEGSARNWLRLDVVGIGPNRFGVGATVEVTSNAVTQLQQVYCGSNYKTQNELTLHFGMDQALTADEIHITWPGGTQRTLTNYPTGERWKLYPPQRLGDGDADGDIDAADIRAAMSCRLMPFTPGCEIFDMDGDGDVDAADLSAMGLGAKPKLGYGRP